MNFHELELNWLSGAIGHSLFLLFLGFLALLLFRL